MAEHQHPPLEQESQADFNAHQATYDGFVNLVKWSILSIAILVIVLYFVIQP